MCGSDTSTISAPPSRSQASPCCHSASISAGMLSLRYSRGTPMRRPRTPRRQAAAKSGTGRSAEVLSRGSKPAMLPSSTAQSSTVRATGPAWSKDDANATMPQREQRP